MELSINKKTLTLDQHETPQEMFLSMDSQWADWTETRIQEARKSSSSNTILMGINNNQDQTVSIIPILTSKS